MPDLTAAVVEYLDALDSTRQQYVQTARNAPREDDVRRRKAARLQAAERALRDAVTDTTEES